LRVLNQITRIAAKAKEKREPVANHGSNRIAVIAPAGLEKQAEPRYLCDAVAADRS